VKKKKQKESHNKTKLDRNDGTLQENEKADKKKKKKDKKDKAEIHLNLINLPEEVQLIIMSFLDVRSLCAASLACKKVLSSVPLLPFSWLHFLTLKLTFWDVVVSPVQRRLYLEQALCQHLFSVLPA